MSVRTMSARAEPCATANPPTAAAEAVTRKPRRDRWGVFRLDWFDIPNLRDKILETNIDARVPEGRNPPRERLVSRRRTRIEREAVVVLDNVLGGKRR